MYYIYILYSERSDLYYIGYSHDPERRLISHNTSERTTFTSKHRPWKMVANFFASDNRGDAMKIEKYLKKQKSREFIEEVIEHQEDEVWIAQLVRVPACRD